MKETRKRMTNKNQTKRDRLPFSAEECYDIFYAIFRNHEDALAATMQLYGGNVEIDDADWYGNEEVKEGHAHQV